jgi:hypothetical protein
MESAEYTVAMRSLSSTSTTSTTNTTNTTNTMTNTTNTMPTITKDSILVRREVHNVPDSVLWGIQLVTKQAEAIRALPADDIKAHKAAMKEVRAAMTLPPVITNATINATRTKQEILDDLRIITHYHDQNPEDKILWIMFNSLWHQSYDLCEADGDFSEFDKIEAERVW